ncbi:MAG: sulfatase-like hydrolase/transferase [Candidatus Altiarchaeales archaeon]|nr:sulfatase-like hydrolase/transferase [Candidatus Altiarchaeales archaeon]
MRNMVFGFFLFAVFCLAVFYHLRSQPGEGVGGVDLSGYNVILLSVETTRADHLGLYGYGRPTTPFLDEYGGGCLVFEGAYAQAPWTRTSMASVVTSRYPRRHGVLTESPRHRLDEGFTTLAEVFSGNNYSTAAYIGHANLKSEFGFSQGFDVYVELINRRADVLLDSALSWINEAEDPFFVWIHLVDPHETYDPPKEYLRLFVESETEIKPHHTTRPYLEGLAGGGDLTSQQLNHLIGLYDGELCYVDDAVKRFISNLPEGVLDDSIVVVTADHGEEFMDHGGLLHGHSLYNELIHVPLLLCADGIEPGRRGGRVELIDVYPTLVGLTGLSGGDWGLEGDSLLDEGGGVVYSESDFRGHHLSAFFAGEVKVIHDWSSNETRLFNLSADPLEGDPRNLTAPERRRYLDYIGGYRSNPHVSGDKSPVSGEAIEQLRQSGYLR